MFIILMLQREKISSEDKTSLNNAVDFQELNKYFYSAGGLEVDNRIDEP